MNTKETASVVLRVSLWGLFLTVFAGVPVIIETKGKFTVYLLAVAYMLVLSVCVFGNIVLWKKARGEYDKTKRVLGEIHTDAELLPFREVIFRSYFPVVAMCAVCMTLGISLLWGVDRIFKSPLTFALLLVEVLSIEWTIISCIGIWKIKRILRKKQDLARKGMS